MKPKTPKHKTYTVHKKPAKKAEWKTIGEVLKATPVPSQLDRIERKLDELLSRPPVQILPPSPGTWNAPELQNPIYEKAPWWMNPNVPQPTLTCNAEKGRK